MPWIQREFTKGQIDKAGRILVAPRQNEMTRAEAIKIVDNWRACHAYPLQVIKMTLLNRARKINKNALIAQRLKRRPSIEIKLRDNPNMQLSQMQDIGGCRAVLDNLNEVKQVLEQHKQSYSKNRKDRSTWDGSEDFDYIKNPKPDGYRSVHLIYRFYSPSHEKKHFNGQRIEIQIRSKLQHTWATAVETAQVFTGQALKSKVKRATDDWLRFFALTSTAFALREESPIVPGTPANREDLILELQEIVNRANIMHNLKSWNDTIRFLEEEQIAHADAFLLVLDPNKLTLHVRQFSKDGICQ